MGSLARLAILLRMEGVPLGDENFGIFVVDHALFLHGEVGLMNRLLPQFL